MVAAFNQPWDLLLFFYPRAVWAEDASKEGGLSLSVNQKSRASAKLVPVTSGSHAPNEPVECFKPL